jgi:prophage regulatory protein
MSSYRFPQVRTITGLSRSTIFRLEREGNFPKRRRLSAKAVGWVASEIHDWLASREMVKGEK